MTTITSVAIAPDEWYASQPKPAVCGEVGGVPVASFRSFTDTSPLIEQPSLSDHVIAIHLGGAKRVRRWQGGRREVWDVARDSVTFMPAARANRWHTEGPIAYAHLTLSPRLLGTVAREEFDRAPEDMTLRDRVGVVDPLLTQLMLTLGQELAEPGPFRLYRENLLTTLALTVLSRHSTLSGVAPVVRAVKGGLAGWQLRRVVDFMNQNVSRDVSVAELVALTRLSRAQFFRAFRQSTGCSPSRYFVELRMRHARRLLADRRLSVGEVAHAVGFQNPGQFAVAFRRCTDVSPTNWRRMP